MAKASAQTAKTVLEIEQLDSVIKKKSHGERFISMNRLESFSYTFSSQVHDATVAKEVEFPEIKKAKAETADARGKELITLTESITKVEEMLRSAQTEKQIIYRSVFV